MDDQRHAPAALPRDGPKGICKSIVILYGYENLVSTPREQHRLRVSENRVLRGTYRQSPNYATVDVPKGVAQFGTYGQAYEVGPVKIQLQHTGIRSPTFVSLRFNSRTEKCGARYKMNYFSTVLCYFIIIIIIIIIISKP